MYQDPDTPFRLPELPDGVGEIQPFPRPVVWSAGLIIALVAVFGLYQGIHGASSRGSRGGGGDEEEGGPGALSAQPAVPIPANTQWSTLNGPAMGAPVARAQSSAPVADKDEDEDSSEPASGAAIAPSTAAESAAPVAQGAQSAAPPGQQVLQPLPPASPDQP